MWMWFVKVNKSALRIQNLYHRRDQKKEVTIKWSQPRDHGRLATMDETSYQRRSGIDALKAYKICIYYLEMLNILLSPSGLVFFAHFMLLSFHTLHNSHHFVSNTNLAFFANEVLKLKCSRGRSKSILNTNCLLYYLLNISYMLSIVIFF